jgi:Ca-activated chloride channel homolog
MPMFHFLRPEWFWALLPAFGLVWLVARKGATAQAWASICDAHLLPHVLVGTEGTGRRLPLVLLGTGWTLAVLALAGPVWSQLPQPVFRAESALVIVLDLSRSMDVQDVTPSRLTRAKHKILDVLKARKEGQTGLVVYAGDSFVVSPLTNDANTMITLVQSLETSLMPLQGSRADLALRTADELLKHVGHAGGDLLLVTDGEGDPAAMKVLEDLRRQGRRVSVLGVGTVEGGPIPEPGGFLKDSSGAIVIPKLDIPALQAMARAGGGRYATLTVDDQDLNRVRPPKGSPGTFTSSPTEQRTTDRWREEGPWLVLLLLPLAVLAFRPGWLGMLLVFVLVPQVSEAFSWESLWFRPDQQGVRALERDAPEEAAAVFQDPAWKGVAHYRAGNYQEAEEAFSTVDTPEGHYNRGNALANLGRYEEALASYQTALAQHPQHADARHNRDIIQKLLEKHHAPQQEGEGSDQASDQKGKSAKASDSTGEEAGSKQRGADNPGSENGKDERPEGLAGAGPDSPGSQQEAEPEQQDTFGGESENPESPKPDPSEHPLSAGLDPEATPEGQPNPLADTPVMSTGQPTETEKSDQALQQWLRRIPDDPGGLLRRKFLLEHQRRVESGQPGSPQGRRW